MKRRKIALLLCTVLLCTGCKMKKNTAQPESSSPESSAPTSSEELFPGSSEAESSEETSSEVTPTVATPIVIDGISFDDVLALENEKKGWGQGTNVDEKNRPVACNQYQAKYGEYGGVFIEPDTSQTIYLTFDEGYENGYTSQILDVLKEKNCHAVFFVTADYVKKNPELIRRMIDEGHAVGNHSVSHLSMPTLSVEEAVKEIAQLHNDVVEQFGYTMTLFRPPMGEWSTRSLAIAQKLGYRSVLWSFAYLDYDVNNQPEKAAAFERVSKAAHPGAVYLLHAVSATNTAMLGDLIDAFRAQGYTLELLK